MRYCVCVCVCGSTTVFVKHTDRNLGHTIVWVKPWQNCCLLSIVSQFSGSRESKNRRTKCFKFVATGNVYYETNREFNWKSPTHRVRAPGLGVCLGIIVSLVLGMNNYPIDCYEKSTLCMIIRKSLLKIILRGDSNEFILSTYRNRNRSIQATSYCIVRPVRLCPESSSSSSTVVTRAKR